MRVFRLHANNLLCGSSFDTPLYRKNQTKNRPEKAVYTKSTLPYAGITRIRFCGRSCKLPLSRLPPAPAGISSIELS